MDLAKIAVTVQPQTAITKTVIPSTTVARMLNSFATAVIWVGIGRKFAKASAVGC